MIEYHWLGDEAYKKLETQTRLKVGAILTNLFQMYGQDAEIQMALSAIMDVTRAYGQRIRGKDKPLPEVPERILRWRD